MFSAAAHEVSRLPRQLDKLERENEHLKEMLSDAADELAKRDRIIADFHWRLTHKSDRF